MKALHMQPWKAKLPRREHVTNRTLRLRTNSRVPRITTKKENAK